jgi:hypothetical protein
MKISEVKIQKGSGYGHYVITGNVNGVNVNVGTTDSEAYDYLNNEDYPEKQQQALEHCEMKLEQAFRNMDAVKKTWKFGTYAYFAYYVNGVLIGEMSEHKNNCGVEYFQNLPEGEDNAEEDGIIVMDIPENILANY